ncbi:hypothetical protein ASPZODRAFT_13505 [Penicilliopsis zonata CBS 506.65]|uniref:Uncharacterized protein n=1 Tax=Penicilliopsis zonata CBS 506.65 TaxID=1073090 RepID=A0A1L9ST84_9EURO|nr:hypothetical protein ASPZODRAFT_13505 [Penicilliopsis zonata CBS 506.65]OJJ50425.1 hypothetical protein ASPZODRAFT_13505 [Penicilliopsis zonata CBS 506.65]
MPPLSRSAAAAQMKPIWSPLVPLRVGNRKTEHSSRRMQWIVYESQISSWDAFVEEARAFTKMMQGVETLPPRNGVPALTEVDEYIVANEMGVAGRFTQHVGQALAPVLRANELPVFADAEAGRNFPPGCSVERLPDFILIEEDTEKTCLVGEIKVPWNTDLDQISMDIRRVLAQAIKYMDDCKCRYGVVTTYNKTLFLKRVDDWNFKVSPAIYFDTKSLPTTPPTISLKEAMVFIAWLAGNGRQDSEYPNKIGKELVHEDLNRTE